MVPLLGGSSVLKSNTRKRRVKSSCPLSFEALLDQVGPRTLPGSMQCLYRLHCNCMQLVDRAHYFLSVPAVSPVPVDALLHSALTYIRYGALASPPVLKALSVVRTTRALHRQSGLGALLRAIQFQAFPFELDNLLSCLRPALKGIPLSGLERQHRKLHAIIRYCDLPLIGVEDPDSADGLSESMEARYHWMTVSTLSMSLQHPFACCCVMILFGCIAGA